MLSRVVLVLLLLTASAHAGSVSVVSTGDTTLQATVAKYVEGWLRKHGHTTGDPLATEVVNTLLNCMLIDDSGCAKGVVEQRAKTDSVLLAQVQKSRTSNATIVSITWLQKGKEPVGMRRACENCSDDLLKGTIEEMLGLVVSASTLERGRLSLHSNPEGMTVLLDNENIGVTPLEREVAAGQHTIVLMHRGHRVGERTLKIHPEVTAEITIPVTMPPEAVEAPEQRSRLLPGLALGLGGAAVIAGATFYLTSEEDDGSQLYYRDTKMLGVGLTAGGLVLAGVGTFLWIRAANAESAPVVSIDRHGGFVGWTRAF